MSGSSNLARLAGLLLASACVGVRPDTPPPDSSSRGTPSATGERELVSVKAHELTTTAGEVAPLGADAFAIRSPMLRAELGRVPRAAAEVAFVYRGPSASDARLASGELRRQIGLKMRARDTCNVLYVMWHIEPAAGIVVSLKSNPGQSRHAECGDRGYSLLRSTSSEPVSPVEPGQRHVLGAEIRGQELWVTTDGTPSWVGRLPAAAFEFDGPVGLRADNGAFEVELRAEKLAQGL